MKRILITLILLVLAWWGCKQAYSPQPITTTSNYLVVEGAINTGADSTIIRLSRTVLLSSKVSAVPELGANVTIISEGGASYPCIETGNGYYKAAGLNVASGNFGLKINTTNGKVYQSDMVPTKSSPPIDSVYYHIQNNGIQIYADTHDPANNSKYYRWNFYETYEFHSAANSLTYVAHSPHDTILARPVSDQIFVCWHSDTSTSVLLNSSAKLTKDIITGNQITFIPSTSEKIESRYSILVTQYVLTADAYNYFQQLKKNTEQLGSIFDAQPTQLRGNVHSVSDPAEPVIGYITAGNQAQIRIYIDNRTLPAWLPIDPYSSCIVDTALFCAGRGCDNQVAEEIYAGYQIPLYAIGRPGSPPIGYVAGSPACIDCTLRGSNTPPAFWQEATP
ncbi:MAG TPA: DUF4249 domain-containing protein [Mucilaginibacter sp.]|jgi:hypothetical protein|nr:DUF4249 domain-containing protein [Mucilaginibacter sp.]